VTGTALPRVMIAVPSYTGQLSTEFVLSLVENLVDLAAAGILWHFHTCTGNCLVHLARNGLAMDFLQSEATHLLFWDDDVGAQPDAARRLLEADRDIVAGCYPAKLPSEAVNHRTWQVYLPDGAAPDAAGLIEADGLQTGFMLIARRVIEGMVEQLPERRYYDHQSRQHAYDLFPTGLNPFLPHGPNGQVWWGEDLAFTALARQCGFRAWLVPDLTFTHTGRYVWRGSFAQTQ
jgi:hypothetical protein